MTPAEQIAVLTALLREAVSGLDEWFAESHMSAELRAWIIADKQRRGGE